MVAILLLNASYEPLAVIPKRRALSLLLRDCVDAVSEDVITLRGMTETMRLPVILKLRRYVNVPKRGARWSRYAVLRRDKYTCIFCGIRTSEKQNGRILSHKDFTIDHLMPKSRGGRNSWTNTACACPNCNGHKGDRTPHEAGMPMRWEPKIPRVDMIIASGDLPESWKFYLEV